MLELVLIEEVGRTLRRLTNSRLRLADDALAHQIEELAPVMRRGGIEDDDRLDSHVLGDLVEVDIRGLEGLGTSEAEAPVLLAQATLHNGPDRGSRIPASVVGAIADHHHQAARDDATLLESGRIPLQPGDGLECGVVESGGSSWAIGLAVQPGDILHLHVRIDAVGRIGEEPERGDDLRSALGPIEATDQSIVEALDHPVGRLLHRSAPVEHDREKSWLVGVEFIDGHTHTGGPDDVGILDEDA